MLNYSGRWPSHLGEARPTLPHYSRPAWQHCTRCTKTSRDSPMASPRASRPSASSGARRTEPTAQHAHAALAVNKLGIKMSHAPETAPIVQPMRTTGSPSECQSLLREGAQVEPMQMSDRPFVGQVVLNDFSNPREKLGNAPVGLLILHLPHVQKAGSRSASSRISPRQCTLRS